MTFRTTAFIALITCAACAPVERKVQTQSSPLTATADAEAPREHADYLIVTAPRFARGVTALAQHRRSNGHRVRIISRDFNDADEVRDAIVDEHDRGNGQLRFVLLVGDAAPLSESQQDRLPTFYLDKESYGPRRYRATFPSDAPYADIGGKLKLAVGRLPVRDENQLRGVVDKIVRYETSPITAAWPRRLVLRAGTADFGLLTDAAIERTALTLLSETVPYDYDLHVTFAKGSSSYANRPDTLGLSLQDDAARGAMFFVFVGHSGKSRFQTMRFRGWQEPLGTSADFEEMVIPEGNPVFVSISCDAGAYDMAYDQVSLSEAAVLNPHGPVAAFASSRVSHPYPNVLYGEAFIESFLSHQPKTLGEGIIATKKGMLAGHDIIGEMLTTTNTDALKQEHVALYNLLGDPATRLRYPEPVTVSAPTDAVAGSTLDVQLSSAVAGLAEVTLETHRAAIDHPLEEIDALPDEEAFANMAINHARANNKVKTMTSTPLDGSASVTLTVPEGAAGRYVVKVAVVSKDGKRFAAGHAPLHVR